MQKEKRSKYLLKNTIIFAIGNFGTKMISFFLVPLYTNVLTSSEYGTVDLITTIITVLVPIVTLNISEAIMRFALDEDSDYDKILSIGVTILIAATVLGAICVPVSTLFSVDILWAFLFYLYVISMAFSQIFLCYLRGREQLVSYSVGNIIHSLAIALLNILFLLVFNWNIKGYLLAYILSNFITGAYAFISSNSFSSLKHFCFDNKLTKAMIKYSVVLIPNSFMWWIMNSSDRVMVTSMISSSANGIYSVSYKIPTLLTTFTTIFNQAWAYSAIRENKSDDEAEYNNNIYDNLVKIALTAAVGLLMIMKPFLKIYVEKSYYDAWKYTPYLIVGFVFMTLGTFLSTQYTVHKDSKGFLFSGTCGALINIILNAVLIPIIGISGAAIATAFSYFSVFAYRVIDVKKYVKFNVLKKDHIAGFIILFLSAATIFIDSSVGIVMSVIEFIAILFITKDVFLNVLKSKFKHR